VTCRSPADSHTRASQGASRGYALCLTAAVWRVAVPAAAYMCGAWNTLASRAAGPLISIEVRASCCASHWVVPGAMWCRVQHHTPPDCIKRVPSTRPQCFSINLALHTVSHADYARVLLVFCPAALQASQPSGSSHPMKELSSRYCPGVATPACCTHRLLLLSHSAVQASQPFTSSPQAHSRAR
jgi:hypothetical protein